MNLITGNLHTVPMKSAELSERLADFQTTFDNKLNSWKLLRNVNNNRVKSRLMMNTENCCRVCLEEPYAGYNLQEYNGDVTIQDLIKKICPEVCVSYRKINSFSLINNCF